MGIEGEYRIGAPRERVWRALTDETILRACLPGCRSLEKVAERTFAATFVMGGATVISRIAVADAHAPKTLSVRAEGEAGADGFAHADVALTLTADGEETLIAYRGSVVAGGRIGDDGDMAAARLADDFFRCVAARLEGGGPQPVAVTVDAPRRRGPTAQQVIIVSGYVIYAIILVLLFLLPKGAGS